MLEEKIYSDYVKALKDKNKEKTTFLSFVRSSLKNIAIDLKKEKLDDEEVLSVLKKEQKRLNDTLESISGSGRQDLIDSANRELDILNQYLPEQLSVEELTAIIDETIRETQPNSIKDMGKVMKSVVAKTGARADAKKISSLVKDKLSSL
jgi:uncharacterized protein